MIIGRRKTPVLTDLENRVETLEDTIHEYEIYESISTGTTGTVTKPENGIIVMDQYPQAGDCLILKTDSVTGRPVDEVATTAAGVSITSTLNTAGAYVISGIPTSYPVALVYQIQLAEKYKQTELDNNLILNETDVSAMNALTSDREIQRDPTGFDLPESVVVTYDASTQKVTLTGTWKAYWRGKVVPILTTGWLSTAHPNVTGHIYYIYYNGSAFVWSDNIFPGFDVLLIAVIYYRALHSFGVRESHGLQPWQCHQNDHYNQGTYRTLGGDITNIVLASTTADNRRPIISACTIWDEDLKTVNAALTSKRYTQRYLTLTNTINYTLNALDIVPLVGNNPVYNFWDGAAYIQTPIPSNSVMTVWLYEVPVTADATSQEIRHVFVQGQSYTQATSGSAGNLTTARNTEKAKTTLDLNLGEAAVVSAEYVAITKFILVYTSSNWYVSDVIILTGNRSVQVGTPSGSFLSSVSVGAGLSGTGVPADPIINTLITGLAVTMPRLTTTERDAIPAPTEGMEIYNLTTHVKDFFNGTAWGPV